MSLESSPVTESSHLTRMPPFSSFTVATACVLLWQARFISRNPNLMSGFETQLHQNLLGSSEPHGYGKEYPVLRIKRDGIVPNSKFVPSFPVVIQGFLAEAPAVLNWSFDFMKSHYGDTVVSCAKQYRTTGLPYQDMTLAEVIEDVRSKGAKKKYLMASSVLFEKHRELLEDIWLHEIASFFGRTILRAELFLGGKDVGSPFHCAPSSNFFCNIHGEKKWVLVAPWHSMWMYPQVGSNDLLLYVNSPLQSELHEENAIHYPLYQYVPKYTVHLKPGDVLYVPPWWWHEVTNIGETIAVPVRVFNSRSRFSPFDLLTFLMFMTKPKAVLKMVPSLKTVVRQRMSGTGSENLLFSDDLMREMHVRVRSYARGWVRFNSSANGENEETVSDEHCGLPAPHDSADRFN